MAGIITHRQAVVNRFANWNRRGKKKEFAAVVSNGALRTYSAAKISYRLQKDIRPLVEADHKGKYVAIDIETRAWEMDASEITASERLRQRVPDAQTWMLRVGYDYIRRFGAGRVRGTA